MAKEDLTAEQKASVASILAATKTLETVNGDMVDALDDATARKVAEKLRIAFAPNTPEETLKSRIRQQQSAMISDAIVYVTAEKNKTQPVFDHDQAEILEAVDEYIKGGMQVEFNDADGTFHFSKGRKQECGTVFQPIRRIKLIAASVCTPTRGAMTLGKEAGDNTYTGTILSA